MGNSDSKPGKSSRRIEVDEVRSLALRLGVKHESDALSHNSVFESLGWNDLTTSITEMIWNSFLKVSRRDPKLKHALDLVDGMVFQDQSVAAECLYNMLDSPSKESIELFVQDIIRLYDCIPMPRKNAWRKIGITTSERTNSLLSNRFIGTLSPDNNLENVDSWLRKEPLLFAMQRHVFQYLFKLNSPSLPELIPLLTSQLNPSPSPSILDVNDIIFLNHYLPHDKQSEWRLEFSTRIHGLSFSSMLGKIMNKGPTVMIVEDCGGNVFGGFASESWRISPKFIGDSTCFIFQIRPNFGLFTSTGYNDHYMYLNQQQQTLPNGLGFGGQLGHFGLWIDADFGKGHCSEGCSTYYRAPILSSEKDFSIENIEVWAVGPPPKEDSDDEVDSKRSILDKDIGAKALLEMIDRGRYSEGLREPDE